MQNAIGMIELSSIAAGYEVQDAMLKAANVDLIIARTICSGKYIVVVGGDVGSVKSSVEAGENIAEGFLIEKLVIPNVDPQIFPAFSGAVVIPEGNNNALGIIETFSASSIIEAADFAAKAADVILFRVHVSMAVGGKGFLLVCGDVAAVTAAVEAGIEPVKDRGMLVNKVVIPSATEELFAEFI